MDIEVSRDSVRQRMLARGRGDDNAIAIENRLNEYDKYIIPMIEKIKEDSFFNYLKIDGEGTIEDIHVDISNKIEKYL
jgi:adenylate kinase family enzyme